RGVGQGGKAERRGHSEAAQGVALASLGQAEGHHAAAQELALALKQRAAVRVEERAALARYAGEGEYRAAVLVEADAAGRARRVAQGDGAARYQKLEGLPFADLARSHAQEPGQPGGGLLAALEPGAEIGGDGVAREVVVRRAEP